MAVLGMWCHQTEWKILYVGGSEVSLPLNMKSSAIKQQIYDSPYEKFPLPLTWTRLGICRNYRKWMMRNESWTKVYFDISHSSFARIICWTGSAFNFDVLEMTRTLEVLLILCHIIFTMSSATLVTQKFCDINFFFTSPINENLSLKLFISSQFNSPLRPQPELNPPVAWI